MLLSTDGILVNEARKDGATPLFIACQEGYLEVVRMLLSVEGIDPNLALGNGCTPLIIASYLGRADVVEILLGDCGPRCDASLECSGKSALEWAESAVRHPPWSYLDEQISEDGRARVRRLCSKEGQGVN